jgi:photosystem II stability/assembly factor-like uncharacterized protein
MKMHYGALALLATAALVAAGVGRSAPQNRHLLPADAGHVSSFAFDPTHPNIVYVGTFPGYNEGRVYKSTDGGDHWRLISGRGWTWLGALAADPRHPGTLYAGTGNAVYKTTDGGRTWRAFKRGLLPPPGINRGEGWVDWLAVDPTNSNVLYEHDYADTIRKSVDGGQSWKPVISLWKRGAIPGLLLEPSRPPALYGAFLVSGPRGAKPGVYATSDGGKTWRNTRLNPSDSAEAPVAVALAADPQRKTIYVAVRARVFSSTNAGRAWDFIGRRLPQDGLVTGLAAGAGTVYAAFGAKGIYQTSDGGRTWTQSWPESGLAPGVGAGLVAVNPARPTSIYASAYYPSDRSTATHILRSTNSGLTWTVVG